MRSAVASFCGIVQLCVIVIAQQRAAIPERRPDEEKQTIRCRIGTTFQPRELYLNFGLRSNADAQDIAEDVLRAAGLLGGSVSARSAQVPNAEACRGDDGRDYILFNPGWLSGLYNEADEYWADRAIIAHELGHIYYNHVLVALGSNPTIELQADEFAGLILARMGATLEQAKSAYRSTRMRTPHDSSSYPSTDDRLRAVEKGWRQFGKAEVTESPAHVIITDGNWRPEAGYVWVSNDPKDLSVRWQPGASYPMKSHVSACPAEGQWCADAGYTWIDTKRQWPDSLDVRWVPGMSHPSSAHVNACQQEGYWCAEDGYVWQNPENPSGSNFATRWEPGIAIVSHPHVVACPMEYEGKWCTAPGYDWVNPQNAAATNFAVRWVPGTAHPTAPHVLAGQTEGYWIPESGYTWVNANDAADFRVRPTQL